MLKIHLKNPKLSNLKYHPVVNGILDAEVYSSEYVVIGSRSKRVFYCSFNNRNLRFYENNPLSYKVEKKVGLLSWESLPLTPEENTAVGNLCNILWIKICEENERLEQEKRNNF